MNTVSIPYAYKNKEKDKQKEKETENQNEKKNQKGHASSKSPVLSRLRRIALGAIGLRRNGALSGEVERFTTETANEHLRR